MVELLIGTKGTGKTKALINLVNTASAESKGDVVCIEKGVKLRCLYDRLVKLYVFGVVVGHLEIEPHVVLCVVELHQLGRAATVEA